MPLLLWTRFCVARDGHLALQGELIIPLFTVSHRGQARSYAERRRFGLIRNCGRALVHRRCRGGNAQTWAAKSAVPPKTGVASRSVQVRKVAKSGRRHMSNGDAARAAVAISPMQSHLAAIPW